MKINTNNRHQYRIQNALFIALFIAILGLVAWLSNIYSLDLDLTANERNSLSDASLLLAERMEGPVTILCFLPDSANAQSARKGISELIGRYQKANNNIQLRFIDPQTQPDLVRAENITNQGEILIKYKGRSQHAVPDEESITNALRKLLRDNSGRVLSSIGHGERKFSGGANFDYGSLSQELLRYGITIEPFNIAENSSIPSDATLLIIASPQQKFLDFEVQRIRDYIQQGGQLLLLRDPGQDDNLQPLLTELGVEFLPGVIIDPAVARQGYNASITVVTKFNQHPVTEQLQNLVFIGAQGMKLLASEWRATALFDSMPHTWSEVNDLEGNGQIKQDKGIDIAGPLSMAVVLTHTRPEQQVEQRIAVLGDGDFLTNQYLGNGENLLLGLNLINWLMHEDQLVAIPPKVAADLRLDMGKGAYYTVSALFVIVIPLGMIIAGVWIWNRRRKL